MKKTIYLIAFILYLLFNFQLFGQGCSYSISQTSISISASDTSGYVSVTTSPSTCSWSAYSNNPDWIIIGQDSTGVGNGSFSYTIDQNIGNVRTGTISIMNGTILQKTFTVNQSAPYCVYSVSPHSILLSLSDTSASFSVKTAHSTCGWKASSNNTSWLTVISGATGTGNDTVGYKVTKNTVPDSLRTGIIYIYNANNDLQDTFFVQQKAPSCVFSISQGSIFPSSLDTSGYFSITTNYPTCGWFVSNPFTSWLTITSDSNGMGNGKVSYTVSKNIGPARYGFIYVINVNGSILKTFFVYQSAPSCYYSISPGYISYPSSDTSGSFTVTTSKSTCAWTAISNSTSWLTITSGSSGTGKGTVGYNVSKNTTGYSKTGIINIKNGTGIVQDSFIVYQDAPPCTYSISPNNISVSSLDTSGSFTVTTNYSTCRWSVYSDNPIWLSVLSDSTGIGNGSVKYTVSKNTGSSRTGTISIKYITGATLKTFTVYQSAPPNNSISGKLTSKTYTVDHSIVYLIKYNPNDSTLTAIDSVNAADSVYSFSPVTVGSYLIKAALTPSSKDYIHLMPTYYGNVLFWNQATCDTVNSLKNKYQADIAYISGNNPGGPGFISGKTYQGANAISSSGNPVQSIQVLLLTDLNSPVACTYTDSNGNFSFSNLAYGNYKVYAEVPGKYTFPAQTTLNSTTPSVNNIIIIVQNNQIISAINEFLSESFNSIDNLFPNPASDILHININLIKPLKISMIIYNITGQELYSTTISAVSGKQTISVPTNEIENGLYNLKIITSDGLIVTRKFLLNK